MAIGVALEGICDSRRHVTPAILAVGGEILGEGLQLGPQLICQLLTLTGQRGLVTYSVDYLASMIIPADLATIRDAWAGKQIEIGPYRVQLLSGRQFWIRRNGSAVLISDLRRWSPGGLSDLCLSLGLPDPGEIRRWDLLDDDQVAAMARRLSLVYADIGDVLDDACTNTGLPRYWRDGPGRIGGALLDQMASPDDIRLYPSDLEREVFSAYHGGRIDLLAAGEWDVITQLDIRSAYPWAMTQLPSLSGARWFRRTQYDPGADWAIWWCEWDIPDGVRLGPFPVRLDIEDGTAYPRTGRGYYWSPEVKAALDAYGDHITVRGGVEVRPANDRRPFADLADQYAGRLAARQAGLQAESQVIKLAINAAYGRLAQERLPDGTRGRWANIAQAGMLTSLVRARMLTAAQEYGRRVLAILTDSLTLDGADLAHPSTRDLGGWSIKGGRGALLLPSGAYHVDAGAAQLDRVAGLPLEQTRGIDWDRIRTAWRSYGLISGQMGKLAWHLIEYPFYVGLGQAAGLDEAVKYRRWMRSKWDVIGAPHALQTIEIGDGSRVYFRPAALPDGVSPRRYVPQAGLLSRRPHQQHLTPRWTIREIDQPTA